MKTKINHLLGAVLSLLVTFGLTKHPATLARVLTIGLASLVAVPCEAAPPGGGGGANGGGIIYYVGPFNGTQAATSVITTMNSNGGGKTTLGGGMFGNPSFVLYNGYRWFIYKYIIPGQFYPDGITQRVEVFALRDDFHQTLNNNENTRVQLTDDPTLQPDYSDWVPGGAQISFKGQRWSSVEPGATVVEGGIYTASLAFGADGNIVGLTAQPAAPAIPFPLVAPGPMWPALATYFCWNPTGDVVVYANLARNELWLADLHDVHIRIYVQAGNCDMPQWSPDGSLIAFRSGYGICTINPDGTNFKVIIPSTSTWLYGGPHFSPGSSHIIYDGFHKTTGQFDVFRATAQGAKRVNLSNTSSPMVNEHTAPNPGAGWR